MHVYLFFYSSQHSVSSLGSLSHLARSHAMSRGLLLPSRFVISPRGFRSISLNICFHLASLPSVIHNEFPLRLIQAAANTPKHQISDLGRPRAMSRDLASAHGLISRSHLALQESLAQVIIMLPLHFAFTSYLSHVTSNVARCHVITHDLASSRPSSIPLN